MLEKLNEIDAMIMELCEMRNEIIEQLQPSIDEDWMDQLAKAYEEVA